MYYSSVLNGNRGTDSKVGDEEGVQLTALYFEEIFVVFYKQQTSDSSGSPNSLTCLLPLRVPSTPPSCSIFAAGLSDIFFLTGYSLLKARLSL
jgi:hypothetical protein